MHRAQIVCTSLVCMSGVMHVLPVTAATGSFNLMQPSAPHSVSPVEEYLHAYKVVWSVLSEDILLLVDLRWGVSCLWMPQCF